MNRVLVVTPAGKTCPSACVERGRANVVVRGRRWIRRAVGATILLLGFLAAGCVTFPQLQSLSRTTSEPRRKKVREHAACLAGSESQQDLIDCMDARGYQFIKTGIDERAQECYSYQSSGKGFPAAYCFEVKSKGDHQP